MPVLRAIAAVLEVLGLGLLEELGDAVAEAFRELVKAVRIALS